jgi:hypothetical protein
MDDSTFLIGWIPCWPTPNLMEHIKNERDQYKNIKNHKHNGTRNNTNTMFRNPAGDSNLRPIDKRKQTKRSTPPPPSRHGGTTTNDRQTRSFGRLVWSRRKELRSCIKYNWLYFIQKTKFLKLRGNATPHASAAFLWESCGGFSNLWIS